MNFDQLFMVNHSSVSEKPEDDFINVIFPNNLDQNIDFSKCFNRRSNGDIISVNLKKLNNIIDFLSNFPQYAFLLNKFKSIMVIGSNLIQKIDDIINQKIIIPKQCMSNFIIYLILDKYQYSFGMDSAFIRLFDFIHIENYIEQIKKNLKIISLAEVVIYKHPQTHCDLKYELATYLLNKGETPLYNPANFNESALYEVLIHNNFNLAYRLIELGCNLYKNEKSFTESPLFYAMYFRNRSYDQDELTEIPDDQWKVIKLMLEKCKDDVKFQVNPERLERLNKQKLISSIYKIHYVPLSSDSNRHYNIITFERMIAESSNPLIYALTGYPKDKVAFILKNCERFIADFDPKLYISHVIFNPNLTGEQKQSKLSIMQTLDDSKFIFEILKHSELYNIFTSRYIKLVEEDDKKNT